MFICVNVYMFFPRSFPLFALLFSSICREHLAAAKMCCKKKQSFEKNVDHYPSLHSANYNWPTTESIFFLLLVTKGPFHRYFSMKNSFDVRPLIQHQGMPCVQSTRTVSRIIIISDRRQ